LAFQIYGLKRDAPGLELADGAVVTEGCRGTKTAKEIAYMDLANRITKLAYQEAFNHIKAGMTPNELSTAVSEAHRKMGANGGGGPQFGLNTAFPTAPARLVPSRTAPSSWSTAAAPCRAIAPT